MLASATVATGQLTTVLATIKTVSGDGSFARTVTSTLRIPVDKPSLGGIRWNECMNCPVSKGGSSDGS